MEEEVEGKRGRLLAKVVMTETSMCTLIITNSVKK